MIFVCVFVYVCVCACMMMVIYHMCWPGMLKDDSTLRDIKLTKGAKMMVIGSTIQDVLTVAPPDPDSTKPSPSTTSKNCV